MGKLYKLLIVEDEKSTLEGLRDCIKWNLYDIEVVGQASNGQEGLEFLLNNPVDIVLTDVVMPLMDGIELVKQIRQRNITTKVVFVSGYWDMPYLKSAFELDAIDYILKPVKLAELGKVMHRVVEICSHEREEKKNIEKMKNKLKKSMPLLREQFMTELLMGKLQKRTAIEQRARFLEFPLTECCYYTVITVQMANITEDEIVENMEQYEINRIIIKETIESILEVNYNVFCLMMNEHSINVIINSQHSISYDKIISIAQIIQENVHTSTGILISIGIGEEVKSIRCLRESYQKSLRALEEEYFLGEGQIIHYKDVDSNSNIPDYYPHYIQEQIFNALRLGNEQKLRVLIAQFFMEIQSCSGMNTEYVQTICLEIIVSIEKFLLESNNISLNIRQKKDLWRKLFRLKTLKQTEEWMCSELCSMAKQIANIQNKRSKSIINRIKEVIQERYADNITIRTLADEFYLTPNYISMLFKKETGESFKEYLTKIRIDKAKTFMQDPTMKLYQIAESVGYTDPDYFTKVFKKFTGVTPTEYRERLY